MIGGVEVYRREIEGTVWRFDFAGLWGSGATFTERELQASGQNTVYSSWSAEGILGPRTGEPIAYAPALWGHGTWQAFLDRHGEAPTCRVFLGEEALGVGCDEACARMVADCGLTVEQCAERCGQEPRAVVDCWIREQTCEVDEVCGQIRNRD